MSEQSVTVKGLNGYVAASNETVDVEGAKGCPCFDIGGICEDFFNSITLSATITDDPMPEIFITPNAPSSTTVTVAFKSITANLTLATAEWNIGDDYYATTPVSETGWTAFKASYVTDGTVPESLIVDFNQWALDNGYLDASKHKFCVDLFVTSAEGCVSGTKPFCYNTQIVEALSFTLLSAARQSDPTTKVGVTLGIEDLTFDNEFEEMVDYSSITYLWEDELSNALSTLPTYPLNMSDIGKTISLTVNGFDSNTPANPLTAAVFDFGTVTNPDVLTEHPYDYRDQATHYRLSENFNLHEATPTQATTPVTFIYDTNKEHTLVSGEAGVSNMLFKTTEGGFIENFRRAFFHTMQGKQDFFFISMVVRLAGGVDDILFVNYQTAGSDSLSHDESANRIVYNNSSIRIGSPQQAIPTGEWGVVTLSWIENPPSNSQLKIQATFKNTASITSYFNDTFTGSFPEFNLDDNIGLSPLSPSTSGKTGFEMNFGDLKEIVHAKIGATMMDQTEIDDLHTQLFNELP